MPVGIELLNGNRKLQESVSAFKNIPQIEEGNHGKQGKVDCNF